MRRLRAVAGERHVGWPSAGVVHVWTIPLNARLGETTRFAAILSEAEARRASRFRFADDRNRFIVSHAAVRVILGGYLETRPPDVPLCRDTTGKPRLDADRNGVRLHFSLSHSRQLAVLALARSEIGVDIESEHASVDCDGLVRRYFSPMESEAYFALPPEVRRRAFFGAWTAKEAYLKGCGDGLARRLDSFSVTMVPNDPPRLLAAPSWPDDVKRWRLARLRVCRGYAGAVATTAKIESVRTRTWCGRRR
jgi:4'-phosphopantetheinyl transferase